MSKYTKSYNESNMTKNNNNKNYRPASEYSELGGFFHSSTKPTVPHKRSFTIFISQFETGASSTTDTLNWTIVKF